MSRYAQLFLLIILASALTGCKQPSSPSSSSSHKILVTASFYPVADIVRQVGGDKVEVSTLLPQGADIHHFNPTMAQIKQLNKSHLVVRMMTGVDPFVDTIMKSVDNKSIKLASIGDGCSQLPLQSGSDHHEGLSGHPGDPTFDPHMWLSLSNLEAMVITTSRVLRIQSPEDSKYFENRCYLLMAKLRNMNKQAQLDRTKWKHPNYIAVHSAFRYLNDELGLNQVGVFEPKPGLQSSARDLRNLIDSAKNETVKCVFVASEEQHKLASTVAADLGLPVYTLDVCTQPKPVDDPGIIVRMQANLDVIRKAME
ncbi:MAG: metal ABC transporter substrate-binding protein [Armatimonadota bacterium]